MSAQHTPEPLTSDFFNLDAHPDADRVILPPPEIDVDPALRARVLRWAMVVSIALVAAGVWAVLR